MTMSADEFDALVARVEATAATQPQAYRLRLLGLAALGYGYIAISLTVLVGLAVALIAVPLSGETDGLAPLAAIMRYAVMVLVLPVAITIQAAVRGLFAPSDPPEGIELTREQTPRLFEFLDQVRSATRAPAFHRVLLHDDDNAGVAQRSRLGLLGWRQNYLGLGLPLLDATAPDEFRAILAHEIGHLTTWNDRLARQVYDLRRTWNVILWNMEQNHFLAQLVFVPFFRWYAPRFMAYSSVLVRQHELAADRLAAQLVGTRTTADLLVRMHLSHGQLCETFWPAVLESVTETPEVPRTIFTDMAAATRRGTGTNELEARLAEALTVDTDSTDTHPCLRDRIAALGEEPRVPGPFEASAADDLLGDALPALRQLMNDTWHAEASEWWHEQYTDACERVRRLAELEAAPNDAPLSIRERWERAELVEAVRGAEAALAAWREIVQQQPRNGGAHLHVARLLFALKRDEGLISLETAVRLSPLLVEDACPLIHGYLSQRERPAELSLCHRWLEEIVERISSDDGILELRHDRKYLPNDFTANELAPLLDTLDGIDEVHEAYLVRYTWPGFPETDVYFLELIRRPDLKDDWDAARAILAHMETVPELPATRLTNVHLRGQERLLAAVAAVPNALIYQRDHGLGRAEKPASKRAA